MLGWIPQYEWWMGLGALLGVLLLTSLWLRKSLRSMRGGGEAVGRNESEASPGLADARSVRDELEQIMIQLQQLSRQLNDRLDAKTARLEAAVHAADQRIRRLEDLRASPTDRSALNLVVDDNSLPSDQPAPTTDSISAAEDAQTTHIVSLADQGQSPVEIARQLHQPVGEIELILSLRNSRQARRNPLP